MTVAVQRLNDNARADSWRIFSRCPRRTGGCDLARRFLPKASPPMSKESISTAMRHSPSTRSPRARRRGPCGFRRRSCRIRALGLAGAPWPWRRQRAVRTRVGACAQPVHTQTLHALSKENAPIMRIARKFGMDIVTDIGDADAHLELPPASPASITGEFITDKFALYDYALKAHVAGWKRINAALLARHLRQGQVRPIRRNLASNGGHPSQPRATSEDCASRSAARSFRSASTLAERLRMFSLRPIHADGSSTPFKLRKSPHGCSCCRSDSSEAHRPRGPR